MMKGGSPFSLYGLEPPRELSTTWGDTSFIRTGSISILPEIHKKTYSFLKLYSWRYYYHTDEPDSKYII